MPVVPFSSDVAARCKSEVAVAPLRPGARNTPPPRARTEEEDGPTENEVVAGVPAPDRRPADCLIVKFVRLALPRRSEPRPPLLVLVLVLFGAMAPTPSRED